MNTFSNGLRWGRLWGHHSMWLAIFIVAAMVAGCQAPPRAPIDPHDLHAAWEELDPRGATDAVAAALPDRVSTLDSFDLYDGITLAEAEATALVLNAELARVRAAMGIDRARAQSRHPWPDPELEFTGERVSANVQDPLTWGGTLSVTLPISGRASKKHALEEAELDAAAATVIGAEWAVLTEIRREWTHYTTEAARVALLDDAIADLDRLVEAGEQFKAARSLSIVEERLLLLGRAHAIEERMLAAAQLERHRLALLAHLGLHPDHRWNLLGELPVVRTHEEHHTHSDFEALFAHPQLSITLAAYEVAERALALEAARRIPDISVGLGAGREDGDSTILFGLGLIPIPVWNQNVKAINVAGAERAAARTEIDSILRDLVGRRAIEHANYHAATERLAFLEDEVAPLADAQLEDARQLTALGRLDLLLLVDAAKEQRRVRLELLEAREAAIEAQINLDALTAPCPDHPALESIPADSEGGSR